MTATGVRMRTGDWIVLAALVLDAALLAAVELVFLPLRFDGVVLPDLGGWPLPVTVLVAAVTTPLLVRSAARLTPRPLLAGLPGLCWVAVTLWLVAGGPDGRFGVYPDWRALLLLAAGALPSMVVLARQGGPSRTHEEAAHGRAAQR